MSRRGAWAGRGSTRAWRRLRLFVLERDRWRCRMTDADGHVCGRQLRPRDPDPRHRASVEHLDALDLGGPLLADPSRLVAACTFHNSQSGALAQARRNTQPIERTWAW